MRPGQGPVALRCGLPVPPRRRHPSDMRVAVVGAGVTGCATALALGRQGHDVVLLDRDPGPTASDPDEVFATWSAGGVAQVRHPHNFLGLGRAVLRDVFPDVYGEL